MLIPSNKQQICSTPLSNYYRELYIGQDPIYLREEGVRAYIDSLLPEQHRGRLAQPIWERATDQLLWYHERGGYTPYSNIPPAEQGIYTTLLEEYRAALVQISRQMEPEMSRLCKEIAHKLKEDNLLCADGDIILVAWGMEPNPNTYDPSGIIISTANVTFTVNFDLGEGATAKGGALTQYKRRKGYELLNKDVPQIQTKQHYTFLDWSPQPQGHVVSADVTFVALYDYTPPAEEPLPSPPPPDPEEPEMHTVYFVADMGLSLSGSTSVLVPDGQILSRSDFPSVTETDASHRFSGWSAGYDSPIHESLTLYAISEPNMVECSFDLGQHGSTKGQTQLTKPWGSSLESHELPSVTPRSGYTFTGWDVDPLSSNLRGNTTFRAQYEPRRPWYARAWDYILGLFSSGCLRWLLWTLLFILLFTLLSLIVRNCSDDRHSPGVVDTITLPDGRVIDDNASPIGGIDNGQAIDITEPDGSLPADDVTPPVVGEDGSSVPIETTPDGDQVISNRLNVFFEADEADVDVFAQDFKAIYSADEYRIIGVDRNVPIVQIQIPEQQRATVREELPTKLNRQAIFVVDETLMRAERHQAPQTQSARQGWHLESVQAKEAWQISKGDPKVKIAVVDDGIDLKHPMFEGKQIDCYNIFRRDRRMSIGQGHGTHVAGIATGNHLALSQGAAGIAPNCSLLAVQISDNQLITVSSLAAGIMYSLNQGAQVVNVSIGKSGAFARRLTEGDQRKIAASKFKPEEKVWTKIISIAERKNAVLVFAAGNDSVLSSISPMLRTDRCISVAAYEHDETLTDFTNHSDGTFIAAPGGDIYSAIPRGRYEAQSGTSMAAPIVSGAIALMKSLNPSITLGDIREILRSTSYDYTWQNEDNTQGHTFNLRIADALKECQKRINEQNGK